MMLRKLRTQPESLIMQKLWASQDHFLLFRFINLYEISLKIISKQTGKTMQNFITFSISALLGVSLFAGQTVPKYESSLPNVIIIFCDDLGYGDLGSYGHPTIQTPNLDKLALEGQRWTNFYAAASVCTPSRAGLLTGRLPARSGMASNKRRVLFPDSDGGLPAEEITIAEILKEKDYATACIGKWHLGHLPEYLPVNHGFDYYYGIPYSNDMDGIFEFNYERFIDPKIEYWNVPLIRNTEIIERPADQTTITKRYTKEAQKFIYNHKSQPFFLYLAHTMPHVPLFTSDQFTGKSVRGAYGDVVEEIDWSVGQIIQTLRERKIDKNTLVVFTSDNGPWLACKQRGGSAGLLRGGKGMTWEGGMREPAVFWWPGKIKPAVINEIGSTLDLLPTIATLAGYNMHERHVLDGYDISSVLFSGAKSQRTMMYFYRGTELYALRKGEYKAHFSSQWAYEGDQSKKEHNPAMLFNLNVDPSEKYNIAREYPEVVSDITSEAKKHKEQLKLGKDQLAGRIK